MRSIVKGFVVGVLGLAVLFGWPAVSLAAAPKPDTIDPMSCTQTSPDRYICVLGGKEYICTPPLKPENCKYSPPRGTPARPQAPVVNPQTPGAIQRWK